MLQSLKIIGDSEKVRSWAYRNAYTLIFFLFLFVLTWILMLGIDFHWFWL